MNRLQVRILRRQLAVDHRGIKSHCWMLLSIKTCRACYRRIYHVIKLMFFSLFGIFLFNPDYARLYMTILIRCTRIQIVIASLVFQIIKTIRLVLDRICLLNLDETLLWRRAPCRELAFLIIWAHALCAWFSRRCFNIFIGVFRLISILLFSLWKFKCLNTHHGLRGILLLNWIARTLKRLLVLLEKLFNEFLLLPFCLQFTFQIIYITIQILLLPLQLLISQLFFQFVF